MANWTINGRLWSCFFVTYAGFIQRRYWENGEEGTLRKGVGKHEDVKEIGVRDFPCSLHPWEDVLEGVSCLVLFFSVRHRQALPFVLL